MLKHDRFPDEILPPPRRRRKQRRPRSIKRPGGGLLLNEAEIAQKLGESRKTVRRWRRLGLIPSIHLGFRTVRYDLDRVREALGKREVGKSKRRIFREVPI